jgi:hypothetical protein
MTGKQMTNALQAARAKVNAETFGTAAWEDAMQIVRDLVSAANTARPAEEYCSVDSGIHRTRLPNGKIV